MRSKRYIFIVYLAIFSCFFAANKASAWETWGSIPMGITIEQVLAQIKGMIMGMLKQQAATTLNQEVDSLVSGNSVGDAMFIVDWQGYMYTEPEQGSLIYANDVISESLGGRDSSSTYIPNEIADYFAYNNEGFGPGAFNSGLAKNNPNYARLVEIAHAQGFDITASAENYLQRLGQNARSMVNSGTNRLVTTYVGNPSQMFIQGNFRNMSLFLSGINTPWAYNSYIQQEKQAEKARLEKIAETKAIAGQGFPGQEASGMTTTPGILVKEKVANTQDLPNKIIAGAKDLPEVITAIVSKMVTQSLQQGIGTIRQSIQREVLSARRRALNEVRNVLGPNSYLRR